MTVRISISAVVISLAASTQVIYAQQSRRNPPSSTPTCTSGATIPSSFHSEHPYDANFKPPKIPASLEILVKEMDEHGIDRCVLVQTIYHGWDNGYLVHCLKAEPKRFKGQGLIDPTDPKVAEKLEYWMTKHGLAGMRFSPMYYQGAMSGSTPARPMLSGRRGRSWGRSSTSSSRPRSCRNSRTW